MPTPTPPDPVADQPPIGRSWTQLYTVVAGALLAEILFFYALMRYFS
jgi:hypothetical protein